MQSVPCRLVCALWHLLVRSKAFQTLQLLSTLSARGQVATTSVAPSPGTYRRSAYRDAPSFPSKVTDCDVTVGPLPSTYRKEGYGGPANQRTVVCTIAVRWQLAPQSYGTAGLKQGGGEQALRHRRLLDVYVWHVWMRCYSSTLRSP